MDRLRHLRRLRRRCATALQALQLPPPVTLTTAREHLAHQRHRPIRLYPLATHVPLAEALLQTPSTDWIVYQTATSPFHQNYLVAHALAHLALDHQPPPAPPQPRRHKPIPWHSPAAQHEQPTSGKYSVQQETEADLFAELLLQRIARDRAASPMAAGDVPLRRLATALGARCA